MALSVAEILSWDPESARDVHRAATAHAAAAGEAAEGLQRLPAFQTWHGDGANAADAANVRLQAALTAHHDDATGVGYAAASAADGMERVQRDLRQLRWEAEDLGMLVEPATSQIVPGAGFGGTAAQLAANVAELRPRLMAIQAEAGVVEAAFASAVSSGGDRQARSDIQAVEYKTGPLLPQDPPPGGPGLPQPPGGWSEDPILEDAQRIAYGHAWDKHLTDFPNMTQEQLAEVIRGMLTGDPRTDPDLHVGQIPGRQSTAIWKDGILLIHDPLSGDGGTLYRPTGGYDEFLRLVGGAGGTPIVASPPDVPPVVPHAPTDPLPVQPPHVSVALPPWGIFEPNGLPPWLTNPTVATPISPSAPTIFPNVPLQAGPGAAPAPGPGLLPHIDLSYPGDLAGDLAGAAETTGPAAAAGGIGLGALLLLLLPS